MQRSLLLYYTASWPIQSSVVENFLSFLLLEVDFLHTTKKEGAEVP